MMERHQSAMDPDMSTPIQVRVVRGGFHLGDHLAMVEEILTVSRSRGEYLKFLGFVEWI